MDELIGPQTVNTLPPATLEAFLDHGKAALTVDSDLGRARSEIDLLAKLGIDLSQITEQLTVDGVALFAKSFDTLMASIAEKSEKLRNSA